MEPLVDILHEYGYWLIFVGVLIDFLGTPLPSFILLLGAGALAQSTDLSVTLISLTAALAALTGDLILFRLGGLQGGRALLSICRMTSDADRCVRRTERFFSRFGVAALFLSKVIPGLKVVATPMAGTMGMPMKKFLCYDSLGTLMWALTFTSLGYLWRTQIQQIGRIIEQSTSGVAVGLGLLLLGYTAIWNVVRRWSRSPGKLGKMATSRAPLEEKAV